MFVALTLIWVVCLALFGLAVYLSYLFYTRHRRRRKFIEARRRRLEDSSHSNSEASNLLDNADEAESKADQETACTIEQGKACKTDQETACKTDEACKTGQEVVGKTDQEPEAKRKGPPTEKEENLINESQQKSEASVKRRASATSAVKVKISVPAEAICVSFEPERKESIVI